MTLDQKQQVALFRYSVIAPLESGSSDPSISNREFFRRAAAKSYTAPDGRQVTVGASTIEKWHRLYRDRGFEGLMPQSRKDEGQSRVLDEDMKAQARFLLAEHPQISAAEVYRTLKRNGTIRTGQVSPSTVERFVRACRKDAGEAAGKDMRRYERPHINEVWYGDTCYGPYLKTPEGKKRLYIIALIDDASRFIVSADAFFNDSFVNLMEVIRSAVTKYGRPGLFSFDNGPSFRNKQMELLAARIGSAVHYCEPFTPTSKSKIERWFLTVRMKFFATLDMRDFRDIEGFRSALASFVKEYNQTVHASLGGRTPQERFFEEQQLIRRLTPETISRSFLLEGERRVSADSVIIIDKQEYEIHYRYAKQRVRFRYSPDMASFFIMEPDGSLVPVTIRPLNKQENADVRRERVRLSGDREDPE